MDLEEERTFLSHLPESYANIIMSGVKATQTQADVVNLLLSLIWCTIFAYFWQYLRNPYYRQVTCTIFSLLICYASYGPFYGIIVVAVLVAAWPFIKAKQVLLILIYAWAQLLAGFLYFWWFHYGSFRMDITATLMGFLVRFYFLAYDQQDMDLYKVNNTLHKDKKIQKYREEHMLEQELTFYDYFSYQICFLHLLSGSNMTTMDYFRLIDMRQFGADVEGIPRAGFLEILKQVTKAIVSVVLYVVLGGIFPMSRIYEKSFQQYPVLLRSMYISWCTQCTKQRYHFIWHMVELPVLTSGAAYNGKVNGNIIWDKHRNINSWPAEFGEKGLYITFNWNMTVNIWLKFYFFDRLQSKSLQVKLIMTRMAGSLFHGIYSGYHIFFLLTIPHSLFYTPCLDFFFGLSRDYVAKGDHFTAWVVYLLRCYLTAWMLNGYGHALIWHEPEQWIAQASAQLWLPHLTLVACFLMKTFVINPRKAKMKKEKTN